MAASATQALSKFLLRKNVFIFSYCGKGRGEGSTVMLIHVSPLFSQEIRAARLRPTRPDHCP